MSITLPTPPAEYSQRHQREMQRQIENEDRRNIKEGSEIEVDDGAVILKASDGSRWKLQVSTAGVLSTVAA